MILLLAKKGAVLLVDECESIFSKRTQDTKDYKSAVTSELLQRMNGFDTDSSCRVMIAATNRPDSIDPAYLRYKRFSHRIYVTLPDEETIMAIVKKRLEGIEMSGITPTDVWRMICDRGLGKYSAADICGIVEETCMLAIHELNATQANKPHPTPLPLTRNMFERALAKNPPRITDADLKLFKDFAMQKD